VHSGHGEVGRLLTSVAAAGRHGNEYNNNNGGGGVVGEDADSRRLMSGGKSATGAVSTGDDVDRPLNLEVHKRMDAKRERSESRNVERDSISGMPHIYFSQYWRNFYKTERLLSCLSRFITNITIQNVIHISFFTNFYKSDKLTGSCKFGKF